MTSSTLSPSFPSFVDRPVDVTFDAPEVTSDAGWLLIAQIDRALGLTKRLAEALSDDRDPDRVEHSLLEQLRQRIYQIAAGYEDTNDASTLRHDPLLKVVLGRLPSEEPLASQPTLCRFENGRDAKELMRMAQALVEHFIQSRANRPPYRLIIEMDGTPDETHGQQHCSYYNGHVRHHCFLPLFITVMVDHERVQIPLGALLRPGTSGNGAGALMVLKRLVERFRKAWPEVQLEVRLDGGFAQPEVYEWLEVAGIRYVINMPRNSALESLAKPLMERAKRLQKEQGGGTVTLFGQVCYQAGSWKRPRRVIVKAQVLPGKDNPRFVVTNHYNREPEHWYRFYTGRGDSENRIKEWKCHLKADRTSCHEFLANQFRLLMHTAALILWQALRSRLAGTGLARAQVDQLILKLMKVGAWVQERVRRMRVRIAASYPYRTYWSGLSLYWQPIPD